MYQEAANIRYVLNLARLWRLYFAAYTVCPGLLLVWMFYPEGDATFKWASRTGIRQGTLEIVIEEVLWSIPDLIKQYEVSLTQMLNDILWPDRIQWQPPTDQTLYRTRPFTEFWVVSIEHLRRVWHADRGRLLLRTPGSVPLGLAYVLLVETNPFPNLSLFYRTMLFEYPSVLFRFCLYKKVICTSGFLVHGGTMFYRQKNQRDVGLQHTKYNIAKGKLHQSSTFW